MGNLPRPLRGIPRTLLIQEMINYYFIPYFKGKLRIIDVNEYITIDGARFKITEINPGRGIVCENTIINYDGCLIR